MILKRIIGFVLLVVFIVSMGTQLTNNIPSHIDPLAVVFYVILIGVILYFAITKILDH